MFLDVKECWGKKAITKAYKFVFKCNINYQQMISKEMLNNSKEKMTKPWNTITLWPPYFLFLFSPIVWKGSTQTLNFALPSHMRGKSPTQLVHNEIPTGYHRKWERCTCTCSQFQTTRRILQKWHEAMQGLGFSVYTSPHGISWFVNTISFSSMESRPKQKC